MYMTKALITTAVALSILGGHIAFAQTGATTRGDAAMQRRPAPRSDINGACVATAVGVRDDALMSAHTTRSSAIVSALGVRKTEVQGAWNMTDAKARRVAREAAWKKFRGAAETARRTFRASAESAYTSFNTAVKTCGVQGYSEPASQDTSVAQ